MSITLNPHRYASTQQLVADALELSDRHDCIVTIEVPAGRSSLRETLAGMLGPACDDSTTSRGDGVTVDEYWACPDPVDDDDDECGEWRVHVVIVE